MGTHSKLTGNWTGNWTRNFHVCESKSTINDLSTELANPIGSEIERDWFMDFDSIFLYPLTLAKVDEIRVKNATINL